MEGPRPVRLEEMPSLGRLVDKVFMGGQAGAMLRCYPQMFNEGNSDNMLVCAEAGHIVSHVGMTQRWACLAGCTLRVACIGSVATYEEYRGRGMATRLFQAACDKAKADGVDFMMISGGRGLYRRAGAVEVGCDFTGVVGQTAATELSGGGIELAEFRDSDLPACIEAYGRKTAHFIRPLDDWQGFIESGTCMCRDARLVVVRRSGLFNGYFIVANTDAQGVWQVIELAGDQRALSEAFNPLMERCGCHSLKLRLQAGDHQLRTLCERAGVGFDKVDTLGTLLLIDFTQLMRRLRPYFEARAGLRAAGALSFAEEDHRFVFASGGHSVRAGRADAAQTIFGHARSRPLDGVWAQIFPAPTLWYGMSYV